MNDDQLRLDNHRKLSELFDRAGDILTAMVMRDRHNDDPEEIVDPGEPMRDEL